MRNYILLLFFLVPVMLQGQNDSTSIHKGRLLLVSSSAASVLAGSYVYVQKSWWSDIGSDFHFDDGSDLRYALNVDKAGHFFGGVLVADMFQGSLQWAGVKEKYAYLYGAALGSFIQFGIEMKDAYYKRSNHYWDLGTAQKPYAPPHPHAYQDDYVNQTYWISFFPLRDKGHHLGISFGFGLDDTQYLDATNTKRGGNNEFYLALDYDWYQLLKKWDTPTGKKVKRWLNYVKLPAPTIRVSPTVEFYPFFM